MTHSTRIRPRWRTPFATHPTFAVECADCPWTYDAGNDFLDATGHAKFHHERAERTVR